MITIYSLRKLSVLCASAVNPGCGKLTAEAAKATRRKTETRHEGEEIKVFSQWSTVA